MQLERWQQRFILTVCCIKAVVIRSRFASFVSRQLSTPYLDKRPKRSFETYKRPLQSAHIVKSLVNGSYRREASSTHMQRVKLSTNGLKRKLKLQVKLLLANTWRRRWWQKRPPHRRLAVRLRDIYTVIVYKSIACIQIIIGFVSGQFAGLTIQNFGIRTLGVWRTVGLCRANLWLACGASRLLPSGQRTSLLRNRYSHHTIIC